MTEKRKEIEEYILRRLGKDAANVQVRVDKNDVTIFTDESLIGRIIGPGGTRVKSLTKNSGKLGISRIFVEDIKDIDKVKVMSKSGNRSKNRTRPESKTDKVRIFFHPFKNKKSVPIKVQPAWDDYVDIIASLKPLAYDKVKRVSHKEFQIIERQDNKAIVYLDI
jgi:hypothetical protein